MLKTAIVFMRIVVYNILIAINDGSFIGPVAPVLERFIFTLTVEGFSP